MISEKASDVILASVKNQKILPVCQEPQPKGMRLEREI